MELGWVQCFEKIGEGEIDALLLKPAVVDPAMEGEVCMCGIIGKDGSEMDLGSDVVVVDSFGVSDTGIDDATKFLFSLAGNGLLATVFDGMVFDVVKCASEGAESARDFAIPRSIFGGGRFGDGAASEGSVHYAAAFDVIWMGGDAEPYIGVIRWIAIR